MTTAAVVELRHIRSAAIDDPERVVQIGRSILGRGGYGSAGDECTTPYVCNADIPDWTIIDQIAVAALITGDDALAKVPSTDSLSYNRTVLIDYRLNSQHPHVHPHSRECNSKPKRNSAKQQNTTKSSSLKAKRISYSHHTPSKLTIRWYGNVELLSFVQ